MTSSPGRSNVFFVLLGAVAMAIVAGALALSGVFDGNDAEQAGAQAQTTPATSAAAAPSAAPGGAPTSVADIYEKVAPAVVFVSASGGSARARTPTPIPGQPDAPDSPEGAPRPQASGSGFVIAEDGKIVTNQHVVDGATAIRVRFGEEGEPIRARKLGEDPSTDIALLKIDPKEVEGGMKVLALADSKRLRPGEATIAIGAPFGLAGSVTTGVVSALNRDIQSPNGFPISGVVQTDAAINPGNSGGPLLDAQGRAIGVNSQIATGGANSSSGVGFAVPIDTVKEVVPLLERDGKIDRPFLGVSTSDPTGSAKGAVVRTVVARGPAAKAGLRPGDRIVKVGDTAVEEAEDVSVTIVDLKPGQEVVVRYVRSGSERTATVRLGTRPSEIRP